MPIMAEKKDKKKSKKDKKEKKEEKDASKYSLKVRFVKNVDRQNTRGFTSRNQNTTDFWFIYFTKVRVIHSFHVYLDPNLQVFVLNYQRFSAIVRNFG